MAGFRRKKRVTPELADLHYKNHEVLADYLTESGRIVGRKQSGFDAKKQRALGKAIRQARAAGLLPFVK